MNKRFRITSRTMEKKTTAQWLEYFVAKAREEGYSVEARLDRLNDKGVSEGKTL